MIMTVRVDHEFFEFAIAPDLEGRPRAGHRACARARDRQQRECSNGDILAMKWIV